MLVTFARGSGPVGVVVEAPEGTAENLRYQGL